MKSLNHQGSESMGAHRETFKQENPAKGIKKRPCLRCDVPFITSVYTRVCAPCTRVNLSIEHAYASGGVWHDSGAKRVGSDGADR